MINLSVKPQHIYPGLLLVEVEGEANEHTASKFKQAILGLVEEEFSEVILDLECLESIDRGGLNVLIEADHMIEKRNGNLSLVCTNPIMMETFRAANLSHYFQFFDNVADAVKEAGARQVHVRRVSANTFVAPVIRPSVHSKKHRFNRDVLQSVWGE